MSNPLDSTEKKQFAPETIEDAHLEQLAENPKNLVYKWEDVPQEESERKKLPVYNLVRIVREIHDTYVKFEKRFHELNPTTDEIPEKFLKHLRSCLKRDNAIYRKFSISHPTCFLNLTRPDPKGHVFQNVLNMVHIRGRLDDGSIPSVEHANGIVQAYFLEQCKKKKID